MIEFHCINCGLKVSVQDQFSGKRVKCPKCGSVGFVPDVSVKIKFNCENCGQIINVPQIHAGKKGKCPKCKNPVVVPSLKKESDDGAGTSSVVCSMCNEAVQVPETSTGQTIECPECGCYVEVPSEKIPTEKAKAPVETRRDDEVADKRLEEPHRLKGEVAVEESAPAGKRKLPWLIDIFLYPTSKGGLTTITIIIALMLLPGCCLFPSAFLRGKVGSILSIIWIVGVYSYMYWYFSECVADSASGGLRAPEALSISESFGEMFQNYLKLLACYAFFFGPVTFYYYTCVRFSHTQPNAIIYWSLQTYGIFFFPMGILAVVIFDSVRGLNPALIIRSITSTFLPYCGLVVLFYGLGILFVIGIVGSMSAGRAVGSFLSPILTLFSILVGFIWMSFVAGHLLGRFYWRYQEKLDWKV
jgi:DNA-directed RNA polymerase subunit RPC12/RpoP